jgi:hypothetical protein
VYLPHVVAAPLLDGDLPLDVAINIAPLDLAWAKLQVDTRRNALESSALTPGRAVALEQIAGLRTVYERRRTLPMRLTVTMVVPGAQQACARAQNKEAAAAYKRSWRSGEAAALGTACRLASRGSVAIPACAVRRGGRRSRSRSPRRRSATRIATCAGTAPAAPVRATACA